MKARTLSYIAAMLLWAICAYEIGLVILRAFQGRLQDIPLFGELLTKPSAAERAAPVAVFVVLGWVLVEIFFHFRRVRREHSAVQQLWGASRQRSPSSFHDELKKISPSTTRAGARAKLLLDHGSAPEYVHEALPAAAALDVGGLESGYVITKAYVWILPVIGFMGTAWGMLQAIDGFSDALADTRDIGVLADRLGQLVIPGLAQAFSITILALGAAIVAHFWVTVMQSREAEVLDDLDHASLALLAHVPKTSLDDKLIIRILQAIHQELERLNQSVNLGDATEELANASSALNEASARLTGASGELASSLKEPYNITITRGDKS